MTVRRWIEMAAVGVMTVMAVAVAVLLPDRLPPVLTTLVVMFVVLEGALILLLPESKNQPPESDDEPDRSDPQ